MFAKVFLCKRLCAEKAASEKAAAKRWDFLTCEEERQRAAARIEDTLSKLLAAQVITSEQHRVLTMAATSPEILEQFIRQMGLQ